MPSLDARLAKRQYYILPDQYDGVLTRPVRRSHRHKSTRLGYNGDILPHCFFHPGCCLVQIDFPACRPPGRRDRRLRRRRPVATAPAAAALVRTEAHRHHDAGFEAGRPEQASDERHGVARWLLGLVRFARWPGGHEPPLRLRRDPAQFDPGTELHRQWLSGQDPRRRTAGRPEHADLRDRKGRERHQARAGWFEPHAVGQRAPCAGGRARESLDRRMRDRQIDALLGAGVSPRPGVLPHQAADDPRRAPGARAIRPHRQLRRRHRQLRVAAPDGRLLVPARLRRQGRPSG